MSDHPGRSWEELKFWLMCMDEEHYVVASSEVLTKMDELEMKHE